MKLPRFGGLFSVALKVIVIVLPGGRKNPLPVPLIGKVPPEGIGAAAVASLKSLVSSLMLRAWFDLLASALLPSLIGRGVGGEGAKLTDP